MTTSRSPSPKETSLPSRAFPLTKSFRCSLWQWYHNGGRDRVEVLRHWALLTLLVSNGKLDFSGGDAREATIIELLALLVLGAATRRWGARQEREDCESRVRAQMAVELGLGGCVLSDLGSYDVKSKK